MIRCSAIGNTISAAPPIKAGVTNPMLIYLCAFAALRETSSPAELTPRLPHHQVFRQRPIERHARIERYVIDTALKAFATIRFAKLLNFLQVITPVTVRIDFQPRM